MSLEYQRGSVFLHGKRRRAWYGKFRVEHKDSSTNNLVIKQRTQRLGLKSEMTRFEAQEKLRTLIADENAHASPMPANVATKELTLAWFVKNRHLPMMSCRDTTKKKTAYEIQRYILAAFGEKPLKEIGLFELQTHLNKLAANFSDSVVRHAYVNMRSIFNNAVDLDFLVKNPARRLNMPDTRPSDKSTLQPRQIMDLTDAVENPMDRCVLAIGIFCALRTSEVFGLTWQCWLGDYLTIRHTAFEGRLQKDKVKSGDSRALVPIPELVQPIIRNWHGLCQDTSPAALMFPTQGKRSRKGQSVPFHAPNFMKRRIYPIADKLGIARGLVTFQVMRRTVGTDLQFHGTLKDAQAALRHKSAGTTANVYMQPVPESVKAALDARTEAVFSSHNLQKKC